LKTPIPGTILYFEISYLLPYIPTKLKIFSLNGNKEFNLPFTNLIIIYSRDEMPTEYSGKRCELNTAERDVN
jgi:hypothetical protein